MYDYDISHWARRCPKVKCKKDLCKCGLKYFSIPAAMGDDKESSTVAPKNGDYCDAIVEYESNGNIYIYSHEGVPVKMSSDAKELEKRLSDLEIVVEGKVSIDDLMAMVFTTESWSELWT